MFRLQACQCISPFWGYIVHRSYSTSWLTVTSRTGPENDREGNQKKPGRAIFLFFAVSVRKKSYAQFVPPAILLFAPLEQVEHAAQALVTVTAQEAPGFEA